MWWWWRWLKRQRHYAEYRQRLIIGRLRALSTWIMIIRWWMVDFTQFWCKNEQSFKYKTLSDKQSIQLYLIKSFNSIFLAILRENWEIYCLSWYSTSDYSISLESKAFFHLNFFYEYIISVEARGTLILFKNRKFRCLPSNAVFNILSLWNSIELWLICISTMIQIDFASFFLWTSRVVMAMQAHHIS